MEPYEDIEKPKLPLLSFSGVIKRRRSILKRMTRFMGFKLEGLQIQKDVASELYYALQASTSTPNPTDEEKKEGKEKQYEAGVIASENPLFQALKKTLEQRFSGEIVTDALRMKLAQVLAGNVTQLRIGDPVEPWKGQKKDEWVLLLVLGAERRYTPKRNIPGGELKLQVMTGSPAGDTFPQFFTDRALTRMGQFIGLLSKWEGRRLHPREFVQMSFIGKLRKGSERFMSEYYERPSLNNRNRKLMRARKLPERVCPHGYVVPCYGCHLGFGSCSLATHRTTLVRSRCPKCREEGLFDPEFPWQKICLHCQLSIWRSAV